MRTIRNYYSFETYNKNFVFISCEYFYLIKFFFHFVQMNISFQTIGKLLNLFSIDITYVHTPYESDKKVIVKASAKKKKKYDSKWFIPTYVYVRIFTIKKQKGKRKKKRESFCLLGPIHARINSSSEFTRECRVNHSFEVLRICVTYDFQ